MLDTSALHARGKQLPPTHGLPHIASGVSLHCLHTDRRGIHPLWHEQFPAYQTMTAIGFHHNKDTRYLYERYPESPPTHALRHTSSEAWSWRFDTLQTSTRRLDLSRVAEGREVHHWVTIYQHKLDTKSLSEILAGMACHSCPSAQRQRSLVRLFTYSEDKHSPPFVRASSWADSMVLAFSRPCR